MDSDTLLIGDLKNAKNFYPINQYPYLSVVL